MSDATTVKIFDSKRVVSNILSLGSGEIGARVIAFVGVTYIARTLGAEGFGVIGFATAIFGYLALTVSGGFDDVGAMEVARRPREASGIAVSVILIRIVVAFVALAALVVFAWSLNKPATVKLVMALMGLSLLSLAFDTSWVYKGLEQSRRVSVALILGQALYVVMVLLVVKGPKDVVFVPLAQFFGELAAATLLIVPILRLGKIRLNFAEGLKLVRKSGIRTLTRLFRTLIFTFDVVLIGFMLGERQVGLYVAPYRICFLLLVVAATINVSYLPALTNAYAQGVEHVEHLIGRVLGLSAALAAPLVIGGMILAAPLLRAVFGPLYVEGAGPFRLLILSIGFVFVHGITRSLLLISNRLKIEMGIIAIATGLNVILNLFLIPRYGLIGAALNTVLAEGLILILGIVAMYRNDIRLDLRPVIRPLLAAGIMGIVLGVLGRERSLVLSLIVGFMTYCTALSILRGIPEDVQPFIRNAISFAGGLRAVRKS